MKKVIFLVINSLNGGGAEHAAARLSVEWSKEYDLKVISLMPITDEDYSFSGEIISISEKYKGSNWISKIKNAAKEIDELAKKYNPATMISFLQNANLCLMFTKYNAKKIISIRNYIDYQYTGIKKMIWNFLIKNFFSRADYVVSVSKLINDQMINKYRIKKEKCVCINNMYEIDRIIEMSNEKLEQKYEEFYKNKKIICNVGHVSEQKGQEHLIRIMPELLKYDKNIGLVIVGNNNSEYANKLINLAKILNVDNNVLFTGKQKNPYKFIKNSMCFVFPSLFEGFPNALVEAMICGKPVIASDCKSGPKEILVDKKGKMYGILIEDDKSKNLQTLPLNDYEKEYVKYIMDFIKNYDMRKKYENKSFERARDFSIDKIYDEWKKII